jgi:isoleucyl-tRNA synthetase
MLRWMAPFLSFTAEEAWALFATPAQQASGTIFTQTYWDLGAPDEALLAKWRQIRAVRDESNRQIELLRSAGSVGSSLQATVVVSAGPATHELLASLGDALKLVLITSAAQLTALAATEGAVDFIVTPQPSNSVKCERCWHWRDDVGADATHPTICSRCVSNLYGTGEQRTIA